MALERLCEGDLAARRNSRGDCRASFQREVRGVLAPELRVLRETAISAAGGATERGRININFSRCSNGTATESAYNQLINTWGAVVEY